MTYEFYKVLHLFALMLFLLGLGVSFISYKQVPKWLKMISGVSGVVILVAGMGLLARLGGGFPKWAMAKMVIWAVLVIGSPIMAKRLSAGRNIALAFNLIIVLLGIWLAVNKPF